MGSSTMWAAAGGAFTLGVEGECRLRWERWEWLAGAAKRQRAASAARRTRYESMVLVIQGQRQRSCKNMLLAAPFGWASGRQPGTWLPR
ncbi:hypothetical protein VFPFJ_03464 [Purpureocillium lilacinum]|uniref:Uncharacterized protein n=1 Tax=Purpureocillium lilacinum TaxID=33203 RepID=A0A179HP10_PURLI|nr:hypothetical protein VFPFJ_03464 [Purpureocillium lilacinum]OAQ91724.1 hypothetical protein VFPFJ_03464 [Purpureocillium lilacinum]